MSDLDIVFLALAAMFSGGMLVIAVLAWWLGRDPSERSIDRMLHRIERDIDRGRTPW
jgi:cytochrome bd-type quinol oxidase subunit 1